MEGGQKIDDNRAIASRPVVLEDLDYWEIATTISVAGTAQRSKAEKYIYSSIDINIKM